jgi:hypothetical protein
MNFLQKALITVGWTLGGTVVAVAIGSVPAALDLVDDYRWGLVIGRLVLPTLVGLFVAGLFFVSRKRREAFIVTTLVLVGYCALVAYSIAVALRR